MVPFLIVLGVPQSESENYLQFYVSLSVNLVPYPFHLSLFDIDASYAWDLHKRNDMHLYFGKVCI
jgi:hypothetical protein